MIGGFRVAVIAIDGPAGSGKSTTARLVAHDLGFIYIDTGAMYRAAALSALRVGIDINNEEAVTMNTVNISIAFRDSANGQRVILNNADVTDEIRTTEVSDAASKIATYSRVRRQLVKLQREMGQTQDSVMEGRDIGTVVFPKAEVKIFLVASYPTRAGRRQMDLISHGEEIDIPHLVKQLEDRDRRDKGRADSPLLKAADAIEIDTTLLTIEEQVEIVKGIARARLLIKSD